MSDTTTGELSTTEFASSNLSSIQLGGKVLNHKKGCKCKKCNKGGQQNSIDLKNTEIIEPLDDMISVGGLRKKTKKCKLRKTKKTRRSNKKCSRRSRKH